MHTAIQHRVLVQTNGRPAFARYLVAGHAGRGQPGKSFTESAGGSGNHRPAPLAALWRQLDRVPMSSGGRWGHWTLSAAADMQPDYLFVKRSRIARKKLPPNENWRWVVYDVTTQQQAQDLFDRGVDLVETDFIGEFLVNSDDDGG